MKKLLSIVFLMIFVSSYAHTNSTIEVVDKTFVTEYSDVSTIINEVAAEATVLDIDQYLRIEILKDTCCLDCYSAASPSQFFNDNDLRYATNKPTELVQYFTLHINKLNLLLLLNSTATLTPGIAANSSKKYLRDSKRLSNNYRTYCFFISNQYMPCVINTENSLTNLG